MNDRTLAGRFWAKVRKSNGCWEWTASKGDCGYGLFCVSDNGKRRMAIASRISYEFEHGDFDKSLCVLHRCDNPACVRPSHLFLGTRAENMRDMVKKGRNGNGQKTVLVTEQLRKDIRHLYWAERRTQRELGDYFGMSHCKVGNIVNLIAAAE